MRQFDGSVNFVCVKIFMTNIAELHTKIDFPFQFFQLRLAECVNEVHEVKYLTITMCVS